MNLSILPLHLLALSRGQHALRRLQSLKSKKLAERKDLHVRAGEYLSGGLRLRRDLWHQLSSLGIFDSDAHLPKMEQQARQDWIHITSLNKRLFCGFFLHLHSRSTRKVHLMSDLWVIFISKSASGKWRFLSPAVLHRMILSYIKANRTIQA